MLVNPSELLLLLRWFREVRHADVTIRPWAKQTERKPNHNSWESPRGYPPKSYVFSRRKKVFFKGFITMIKGTLVVDNHWIRPKTVFSWEWFPTQKRKVQQRLATFRLQLPKVSGFKHKHSKHMFAILDYLPKYYVNINKIFWNCHTFQPSPAHTHTNQMQQATFTSAPANNSSEDEQHDDRLSDWSW